VIQMVKAKLVSMKELTTDNPTFCLSALRAFDECHKCEIFLGAYRHDTIGRLKCKPHLTNEVIDLLKKKRYLLDQLQLVNALLDT
jgi:hypothetical protein